MSVVKENRLLVIGAGWEQIPLILEAKQNGCYVLAADSSEKAEGFEFADRAVTVNPRDLPKLVNLVEDFKPDGIVADECDYSCYAAKYLRAHISGNATDITSAQLTTNKHWMRKACEKSNVKQPLYAACRTFDEVIIAVDKIGFPIVIKPVDNRGSFGVKILQSAQDLHRAFLDSVSHSHSREVLVEQYIDGVHITVDGFVSLDGTHQNLCIASKNVIGETVPIIMQVDYPAKITQKNKDDTFQANSKIIDSLGIKAGLTHVEYVIDKEGQCFLLEAANRGGGVWTSAKIVPLLTKLNLSRFLVYSGMGWPIELKTCDTQKFVSLRFFSFSPGVVHRINGLDSLKRNKSVVSFRLSVDAKTIITKPQDGAGRHGFVILTGTSHSNIDHEYDRILNSIEVVYKS